jgi:hypothetical protein
MHIVLPMLSDFKPVAMETGRASRSRLNKLARHIFVSRQQASGLKRAQEVQYILLLGAAKVIEILNHGVRFTTAARVVLNGREQIGSAAIVQ